MNDMKFATGSYNLNSNPNFNYQLNRVVMWNGGELEEIKEVASKIKNNESWKRELIVLGDKARSENRIKESIAYYRMSEFFMYDGDPDKLKYYKLSKELFYDFYKDLFGSGKIERYEVPYEDINLPVMYKKAIGERKDIILLHGGNDSYFEELVKPMLYLSSCGYDVYLFEGPGQGGVLRERNKKFTYQWERPVGILLDYFSLHDITIIGISLGGMLAPRAAAFEKRIKRVVAWSVFTNFSDILLSQAVQNKVIRSLFKSLLSLKFKFIINLIFKIKLKKGDELVKWGLLHGMYAYGAANPYDYLRKMAHFQIENSAELIEQDILIIGAKKDHFIDYHLINEEIDSLVNVKSLSFNLFTEHQNAEGHCNVGNTKLILDSIMKWIDFIIENE